MTREIAPKLRAVGYITPRGRATVWADFDGTFDVVLDSKHVVHFERFENAELYAAAWVAWPQSRMGE